MFAKLTGKVERISEDTAIIDVNGVGYLIFVPSNLLKEIPEKSTLYTQTVIREDSISIYGFRDNTEKELFNLLVSVQGVGPKLGLTIMSTFSVNDIIIYIQSEQMQQFKSVSGVGVKVAQRIVSELKDKIAKISAFNIGEIAMSSPKQSKEVGYIEAEDVLQSFGYMPLEIRKVLDEIKSQENPPSEVEVIVKEALRIFSQKL